MIEVIEEEVNLIIKFFIKLIKVLVIICMFFLLVVLMLVFIGGVYVYYYELGLFGVFNWWLFIFVVIGVVLFYFGSNVMNDYFDVKDGIDGVNNDYFL